MDTNIIEVLVDNLKPCPEDNNVFDDHNYIESSVDILLLLKGNTRTLEDGSAESGLFYGFAEAMYNGGFFVFPLRFALRSLFFIPRNTVRVLRIGSETQYRMKIIANVLMEGSCLYILIGFLVFLLRKIIVFPVVKK